MNMAQYMQAQLARSIQTCRVLWDEVVWWWTWRRFVNRFVPLIHAAQESGLGRRLRWIEPETPSTDILAWIDFQVATSTIAGPCFGMSVVLMEYTPDQWAAAPIDTDVRTSALPWERCRIRWVGAYAAWSFDGRPQIAAALDQPHAGLFVVVTTDGPALAAVLRDQSGRPSATHATSADSSVR